MKFILILLMLMSTPSCAGLVLPRMSTEKKGIDAEFKPYIASYRNLIGEEKYQSRFDVLSMNFKDLEDSTIGRCWWLVNGKLEIEIDKVYWKNETSIGREFLAYHELDHCIRSRLHTNRKHKIENILDFFDEMGYYLGIIRKKGTLEDGCPASLMHSHTMSWFCREKHYIYYLEELKNYKR